MKENNQINWTDFLSAKNKVKLTSGKLNSDYTCVGIDFGTSTTVVSVAILTDKGEIKVEHIPLKQKLFSDQYEIDYRVNSCIALMKNKILIGKGAKNERRKLTKNVDYWESFKMELGTDQGCAYPYSSLDGSKGLSIHNPIDATTIFFKYLKKMIDDYITENALSPNIKYVVTIPASFEASQRRDLLECLNGAKIELEQSCLVDEPNAAFLSYFLDDINRSSNFYLPEEYNPNVLVFDFGAGTCDISILEIGQNHKGINTKNLAVSRYTEIGGNNIDYSIAKKYLLPQVINSSNIKQAEFRSREIEHEIIPQLIPFAEEIKIKGSKSISLCPELLDIGADEMKKHAFQSNKSKRFKTRLGELFIDKPSITLKDYIDSSSQFCFDTDFRALKLNVNPIFSALEKAKLSKDDVDYVLFIGGSSKNLIVRNQVEHLFSEAKILLPRDLQSHVSKGAALQSLFVHQFNTQIVRPISNQRIFTLIEVDGNNIEMNILESGIPIPFIPVSIDKFHPQRNGQNVIQIPFFVGDQSSELSKIEITSNRDEGFLMNDKIELFVEIDENKIIKLKASVNQIEAKVNIENPFITLGKSYKQKEIQEALKKYNLSTKSHGGKPPITEFDKLINVYVKYDEYMNAAELLEEAVELHNIKTRYNDLNLYYGYAGRRDKAIHYAELALIQAPHNQVLLFNMALHFRYTQPNKAIDYLKRSHGIDSTNPATLFVLGEMMQNNEGNRMIQKSFEIWNQRYNNNSLREWEYGWFESCARRQGKFDLANRIKESNLEAKGTNFFETKNLMSYSMKNK